MTWVLVLWLTGCNQCGADYRGSITTQEFYNKESCLTALNFVRQQSKGRGNQQSINGVCVPNTANNILTLGKTK